MINNVQKDISRECIKKPKFCRETPVLGFHSARRSWTKPQGSNHAVIPRIICVATQGSGSTSSVATGFMLLVLKNHKKWAAFCDWRHCLGGSEGVWWARIPQIRFKSDYSRSFSATINKVLYLHAWVMSLWQSEGFYGSTSSFSVGLWGSWDDWNLELSKWVGKQLKEETRQCTN